MERDDIEAKLDSEPAAPAARGRRWALLGLGGFALLGAGALAFDGRRLLGLGPSSAGPSAAPAAAPDGALRDLTWDMLRPPAAGSLIEEIARAGQLDQSPLSNGSADGRLLGVVPHGSTPEQTPQQGADLVADLEGARVRLPGYTVPLAYGPEGTTEFLLVPYVGACVHVPPPPPNQIVIVASATPIAFAGLFDAVYVTGRMSLVRENLDLADVGYRIDAESVEVYEEGWSTQPAAG